MLKYNGNLNPICTSLCLIRNASFYCSYQLCLCLFFVWFFYFRGFCLCVFVEASFFVFNFYWSWCLWPPPVFPSILMIFFFDKFWWDLQICAHLRACLSSSRSPIPLNTSLYFIFLVNNLWLCICIVFPSFSLVSYIFLLQTYTIYIFFLISFF